MSSVVEDERLRYDGVIISSRNIPVELPTLKYGYRTERFQWAELCLVIDVEKDLEKLARSESQQREYEIFRYHLKQQYTSVFDYILVSKLGFEKVKDNGLWRAEPPLKDLNEVRKALVPNDFPYFMADGIVHYVLWKTKEDVTKNDIEEAREELVLARQQLS